jgi:threonine aldolase
MTAPDVIDLMSDTVTRPTPAMREAMATCEVGDDVFGKDPTVIELERMTATMVGMEASLWCPTGTMANQVAIATHTHPGQEVIAGNWSHVVNYELGGIAWNSLCQLYIVSDEGGWLRPENVRPAIREETAHTPGTGLLCLENTHNRRGGRIMPLETHRELCRLAHERNVLLHLDGARIWNASVASGIPVPEYTADVDSMMFCLSKGLASPAGSMLCGTREFIDRARRLRKRFGGGLRQAGVLAACGIVSLNEMIDRLAEDHANAKELASKVLETETLEIDPTTVETNICIFTIPRGVAGTATDFVEAAEREGLLVTFMGDNLVRMVTHCDFRSEWTDAAVERTVKALSRIA